MAEICPFQAWRYDPAHCTLASVVTQPYDKITPEMQQRYYWNSPYNLVRIILGKTEAGDNDANNAYSRAAAHFRDWRTTGVLVQDRKPSVYAYSQHFELPSEPGQTVERRGLIALGKLYDYSEGVVFRHEQTLTKPKADRLNLLRATRAHFGQIFMLYDDPGQQIEAFLPWHQPATVEVMDEYGVKNRMWQVSEPAVINCLNDAFSGRKLIIADGHHRYETALAYRAERQQAEPDTNGHQPWDYVMMTFVNLHSPGMVILPTHRAISHLPGFDAERFAQRSAEFFEVEPLGSTQSPLALVESLRQAPHPGNTIIAITQKRDYLLRTTPKKLASHLASLSERQRTLDVVVLHKLLLERVLGLSEHAIREQRHISYLRDAQQAIAHVRGREAELAFLINPVKVEQIRDLALGGELMPQKSTDFYPKLLSGMTIYAVE